MGSLPIEESNDLETRSMERAHYERCHDDIDELMLVEKGKFFRTEGTGQDSKEQVEMMKKHVVWCVAG